MIRVFLFLFLLHPVVFALAVSPENMTLEWNVDSLRLVAEGGVYSRIIRLKSGDLLCCYQRGGQSWVKRSYDNGNRWGEEVTVTDYQHGVAANPELLQLQDGRVLLCYNERPRLAAHPYSIMTVLSDDEGRTWKKANRLFTAGFTKDDGCWEPVALQYPDGEIQVFFANEKPYLETNEQEISMISSHNPSRVWTVSRRNNARDGMPVSCILNDGRTVVMAIEDSRWNDECGRMKPVIMTSSVKHRWKEGRISGDSRRRQYALKAELPPMTYLGAPYLVQMPTGITVLSSQLEDGNGVQQMAVYLGDERAQNFSKGSMPFPMAGNAPSMWNSLFVKDRNTVTAVSGTRINGKGGIWIIDGVLTMELQNNE